MSVVPSESSAVLGSASDLAVVGAARSSLALAAAALSSSALSVLVMEARGGAAARHRGAREDAWRLWVCQGMLGRKASVETNARVAMRTQAHRRGVRGPMDEAGGGEKRKAPNRGRGQRWDSEASALFAVVVMLLLVQFCCVVVFLAAAGRRRLWWWWSCHRRYSRRMAQQ